MFEAADSKSGNADIARQMQFGSLEASTKMSGKPSSRVPEVVESDAFSGEPLTKLDFRKLTTDEDRKKDSVSPFMTQPQQTTVRSIGRKSSQQSPINNV